MLWIGPDRRYDHSFFLSALKPVNGPELNAWKLLFKHLGQDGQLLYNKLVGPSIAVTGVSVLKVGK